jgi:hypothetical protein
VQLSRGLEGSIHTCQSVVLWESLTGHTPEPAAVLDRCLKKKGNREREREREREVAFCAEVGVRFVEGSVDFLQRCGRSKKTLFGRLQALYRRGRVNFSFLSAFWAGFGGK